MARGQFSFFQGVVAWEVSLFWYIHTQLPAETSEPCGCNWMVKREAATFHFMQLMIMFSISLSYILININIIHNMTIPQLLYVVVVGCKMLKQWAWKRSQQGYFSGLYINNSYSWISNYSINWLWRGRTGEHATSPWVYASPRHPVFAVQESIR